MSGVTGVLRRLGLGSGASDVEAPMRKIALLIAATALILGSVEVWAGGSWAPASADARVFVICNAL